MENKTNGHNPVEKQKVLKEKTMPPGRIPMPIEQRAKQIMPFAAVTGLEAALREKERAREEQ